ncbi:MAG: hypothetical protein QOI54_1560 [Actinomycetota bacterium]|nr:hypothetical protein [Actinomycetota bacterium]
MTHAHGAPTRRSRRRSPDEDRTRRRVIVLLAACLVPVVASLVAGAVALWPHSVDGNVDLPPGLGDTRGTRYVAARVLGVQPFDCQGTGAGPGTSVQCGHVTARVTSGADKGRTVRVDVEPTVLRSGIERGDRLRLARFPAAGAQPAAYVFNDFQRARPMVALAVTFAVLVIAVARLRGVAALVGLVLSFLVLLRFMIPALLSGESPLAVGLVGCASIMFVLLYLAHGVSIRTTTALFGTLFGLAASAALGTWAVQAAHLTGAGSEDDLVVAAVAGQVRLSGLLLCGIIVASLGILNDVTVTQASAVWELHALRPDSSARRLFAGAMRIGRDHIASTVYTIVFAYAGSALPVLLLIDLSQRPLGTVVTNEALGEEAIRTLVGSIGLVLSVPLTTAVAVALVRFSRDRGPSLAAASAAVDPVR